MSSPLIRGRSAGLPTFRKPPPFNGNWHGRALSSPDSAPPPFPPCRPGLGLLPVVSRSRALAVWLYQRRVPGAVVTPGMGMRIGAVSGAIGYVAATILIVLRFAFNSQEIRTELQKQMDKSLAANPDPRAQEIMRQFVGNLSTPQGLATFFVLMLVIMAVVFVIFSAAGGAFGASMFARRRDFR